LPAATRAGMNSRITPPTACTAARTFCEDTNRSAIAPRSMGEKIAPRAANEYATPMIESSLWVASTRPSVANQEPKTMNSSSIIALRRTNSAEEGRERGRRGAGEGLDIECFFREASQDAERVG